MASSAPKQQTANLTHLFEMQSYDSKVDSFVIITEVPRP